MDSSANKNYQIKAIKAGVPDISTLRDRSLIEGDELPAFSPLCWCLGGRGALAIIWTAVIFIVCVVCPLISFTADIAFYVTCNQLHVDTVGQIVQLTNHIDIDDHLNPDVEDTIVGEGEEDHGQPNFDIVTNNTNERCRSPNGTIVEAQLRKFRHLLENIYKPALIIGCVLSTTLCVFFRVVVLGCGHSHLLSAFVATMLYSCLPVLTGIVSVTAAGFVLGPTSVPCLLASLPQNDKKDLPPLEKSPEVFWFGLSFLTKAIDSLASGYVLFVVTFRAFFRKHGHEHLWWHLGRALGAVFSLILWFSVMPLLVLSPAIGMTLFGPNWNGNYGQDDSLAQIIKDTMPLAKGIFTVIFSISAALWGLIVCLGAAYFIYRSWLFKRRQE